MNSTNNFQNQLIICGIDEVSGYRNHHVTHMVSVANPKVQIVRPTWFTGEYIELYFGDVVSANDAAQYKTIAPTIEDVSRVVDFTNRAWSLSDSKVLIHCDYGASRSPALAYVALADALGEGDEDKALQTILEIRPDSVPNKMIVQLGDLQLKRNGALLKPLYQLYQQITVELFLSNMSVSRSV